MRQFAFVCSAFAFPLVASTLISLFPVPARYWTRGTLVGDAAKRPPATYYGDNIRHGSIPFAARRRDAGDRGEASCLHRGNGRLHTSRS